MAVPVILAAVGTAVAAFGAVSQGQAAASQARSQQRASEFNAAIAAQNATLARQQAAVDSEQAERQGARKLGAVRAAAGASGLASGSVSDLLADVAASSELDVLLTRYKGEVAATGFGNTAALDRERAGSFESQIESAQTAGYLSAAGTLLKGGAGIYDTLRPDPDPYPRLKQA